MSVEKGLTFRPQINQRSLVLLENKKYRSRNTSREASPVPRDYENISRGYRINTGFGGIDYQTAYVNSLELDEKTKFFIKQLDNM